jgi:hypothetical protein
MRRYEPQMPRISFGLAAVALSVVTFGLMVMLPAGLESGSGGQASPALAAASQKPIEVAIIPAHIVVTGQCEEAMAYERAQRAHTVGDRESCPLSRSAGPGPCRRQARSGRRWSIRRGVRR